MRNDLPFDLYGSPSEVEVVTQTPDGFWLVKRQEAAVAEMEAEESRDRERRWPLAAFVRRPGVPPLKIER